MKPVLSLGPLAVATLLTWGSSARAEQFIVTDVSYTHSAATTSDSHYRVSPSASTPKNWQSPVDYSTGSVHVLLEVKTKPAGGTKTKFQICFEGTPDYACTDQSPTYTATGTYQWTTKFSDFYYGGDVDWSKGVNKVALILKDDANNKPQGDPKFVPSDLRVEVAVITAGSSFVAPMVDAGTGQDAGATDAGAPRADAGDAGNARPAGDAGRDAGTSDSGGGAEPVRDSGSTSSNDDASSPSGGDSSDAGTGSASGGSNSGTPKGSDAGDGEDDNDDKDDGGCSVALGARGETGGVWLGLGVVALVWRRRRRG